MARKEFSQQIVEQLLIDCRRHCCVCGKFCGVKIEIHHIEGHDNNSADNAIAVCFDCHAEINHYNAAHPRGRRYRPRELRRLKEITTKRYEEKADAFLKLTPTTDYGQGFYEGSVTSEKRFVAQLVWRFVSKYGDFAIEILTMFERTDHPSIMDDTLYDENTDTGHLFSQPEGHQRAWDAGMDLGLWNINMGRETLFLTKRGKAFSDIVRNNPDLSDRYNELKGYWSAPRAKRPKKKPGARLADTRVFPGYLGILQMELYSPVKLAGQSEYYVIQAVSKEEVILQSMQSPKKVYFAPDRLKKLDVDAESGVSVLDVPKSQIHEM